MPVGRQRKLQIEERRSKVAELALKGLRQTEIAAQLGVAQATVSYDLKRIRSAWRDSSVRDFDATIVQQLDMLLLLQREAWAAWERSKTPMHTAVIEGEGDERKTRQTIKRQNGDPRFLEQIHECLAVCRELLGLGPNPAEQPGQYGVTLAQALQFLRSPNSPYSNEIDVDKEYDRIVALRQQQSPLPSREV